MPIDVTCKACGNVSTVPDTAAGAKRFCKMCGTAFMVPGGAAPAKPPAVAGMDMLDFGPAPAKANKAPAAGDASSPAREVGPAGSWPGGAGPAGAGGKAATRGGNAAARGLASASPVGATVERELKIAERQGDSATVAKARPGSSARISPASAAPPPDLPDELALFQAAGEADAPSPDLLDYPCRVCERLFLSTAIYAEADGDTICKMCWREAAHEPRVPDKELPGGLQLAPAAPRVEFRDGQLFCERCRRPFDRKHLHIEADGAVLCRNCARKHRIKLLRLERQAQRMKEVSATPGMPRRQADKGALAKNAMMVAGALGALGLLAWTLKQNGVWFGPDIPARNKAAVVKPK